jgi:hypothetical protein
VTLSATFRTRDLPFFIQSRIVTEGIVSIGEPLVLRSSGTCFEIYMGNLVHDVMVSFTIVSRDTSG